MDIDPGFGFAKIQEHSYTLMNCLQDFDVLQLSVMDAVSHKTVIYKSIDETATDALNTTTAFHAIALTKGANVFRVHDEKEAVETVKIFMMCK